MSKYGDVIRQARRSEAETPAETHSKAESGKETVPAKNSGTDSFTGKPENQKDGKAANQITGKPASQQGNGRTQSSAEVKLPQGKTAHALPSVRSGEQTLPPPKEEEVNLSIKVPKSLRRHWVSEAKRQDTTLTAVIIESLKARFGEPQG